MMNASNMKTSLRLLAVALETAENESSQMRGGRGLSSSIIRIQIKFTFLTHVSIYDFCFSLLRSILKLDFLKKNKLYLKKLIFVALKKLACLILKSLKQAFKACFIKLVLSLKSLLF